MLRFGAALRTRKYLECRASCLGTSASRTRSTSDLTSSSTSIHGTLNACRYPFYLSIASRATTRTDRHHATGHAADRRLRARAVPPQPARPRLQTSLLPPRSRRDHDLWILEDRTGNQRAKVRLTCHNSSSLERSIRFYRYQRLTCVFLSELAREKMWARIHLIPMMQAEEDRDQVRRMLADKAREKALLGAETKVYNSDRYVIF